MFSCMRLSCVIAQLADAKRRGGTQYDLRLRASIPRLHGPGSRTPYRIEPRPPTSRVRDEGPWPNYLAAVRSVSGTARPLCGSASSRDIRRIDAVKLEDWRDE